MVSILTSTDTSLHYSVIVNVIQLMNFDSNLWYQIHTNPIETLSACNKTIKDLQRYLIEKEKENNAFSFKDYVEVRMRDLPLDGQYTRYVVPSTSEVGKLLSFRGTVIRTSPVKILEKSKMFKCKKCRQTFNVEADFEQCFLIAKPVSCPQEGCNSFKLALHDEEMGDGYHDYQEIKLQEHIQRLDVGSVRQIICTAGPPYIGHH
jgi:DNA replicative helicase MCM subunit Mcm2 (Cdc46/Mcm family)